MAEATYVCPNCGGDVLATLDVFGPSGKVEEDLQVKPKGSVGVCQDCNMAVATVKENSTEGRADPAPPPEEAVDPTWNPRLEENPPRPEDDLLWDPKFGGSTSPEVALEKSVPDPEKDETLTLPETTVLATDPVGEAEKPL